MYAVSYSHVYLIQVKVKPVTFHTLPMLPTKTSIFQRIHFSSMKELSASKEKNMRTVLPMRPITSTMLTLCFMPADFETFH